MQQYSYEHLNKARRRVWAAVVVAGMALFVLLCGLLTGSDFVVPGVVLGLLAVVLVVISIAYLPSFLFDWRIRKTFEHVCDASGLSSVGSKFDIVQQIKDSFFWTAHIAKKDVIVRPALKRLQGNSDQWQAEIVPLHGQAVSDYNKLEEVFTLAFHVPYMTFDVARSGAIRCRAGRVVVPESVEHTSAVVVRPLDVTDNLRAVPVAYQEDGTPYTIAVEGQHVLIAGRTGSGKGSWIWNIVLGLAPAIDEGICQVWAIDPKRVELAIGRHWFAKYADNPADMVDLIEEFLSQMQARGTAMQGRVRKFTPSVATPLNILLIDELAYITSLLPDKKLKDRAMQALTTILTQGRAIGYSVVGAIQDPRMETLPNRDSFPVRIALGLARKQIIDMVLGDGAYDDGALCDQIPIKTGQGVGYVVDEMNPVPLMVRAYFPSDARIMQASHGAVPSLDGADDLPLPSYEAGLVQQLDFPTN